MAVQAQFLAYVLEQLAGLGDVRANRMFGGIGLYSDASFFGLIDDDTVFFKTADSNIARYRERGMPRFMPFPDRPEAVMGYHQVPADVIEDAETLVEWARASVSVALEARAAKARPTTRKQAGRRAKSRAQTILEPPASKKTARKKTAHRNTARKKSARRKPRPR